MKRLALLLILAACSTDAPTEAPLYDLQPGPSEYDPDLLVAALVAQAGADSASACAVQLSFLGGTCSATPPPPPPPPGARVPISSLVGGSYMGFEGGLYDGTNVMPAAHASAAPVLSGPVVMLSLGMSNARQFWCSGSGQVSSNGPCDAVSFMASNSAVPSVDFCNYAANFHTAPFWTGIAPRGNYGWGTSPPTGDRLGQCGLTNADPDVVWVQLANNMQQLPGPALPDPNADAYRMVEQFGDMLRKMSVEMPNVRQVFFSPRRHAECASPSSVNPEPYAYETGWAIKWLIGAQITQRASNQVDPRAGDLLGAVPWIDWGPYLWDDSEPCSTFSDGIHPNNVGRTIVSAALDDFFNASAQTGWYR